MDVPQQTRRSQTYSEEQRRVAAAAFYIMSKRVREALKLKKIDRDYFFLMTWVYITAHCDNEVMVSDLAEIIGRKWGTANDKLKELEQYGLVELQDHSKDGRGWSVRPGQRLSEVVGTVLDVLIDSVMMTAKGIKARGRSRRILREDVRKFDEEISKISRL